MKAMVRVTYRRPADVVFDFPRESMTCVPDLMSCTPYIPVVSCQPDFSSAPPDTRPDRPLRFAPAQAGRILPSMPAAPRARPADLFSPDEWAPFQTRPAWAGPLLVLHCWGVILLTAAAGVLWPILIPLCVAVIGTR